MWEQRYDETLRAPYWYDAATGAVSFDLPSEVHHKKRRRPRLLTKITTALSRRKLEKSQTELPEIPRPQSAPQSITASEPSSPLSQTAPSYVSANSHLSGPQSTTAYTLDRPCSLGNLQFLESYSVSSLESIHSFYLDMEPENLMVAELNQFDRDQERLELRQQILRELF